MPCYHCLQQQIFRRKPYNVLCLWTSITVTLASFPQTDTRPSQRESPLAASHLGPFQRNGPSFNGPIIVKNGGISGFYCRLNNHLWKTFLIEFFVENFDDLTAKDYPNNKNSVHSFQGLYLLHRNILGRRLCGFWGRLYLLEYNGR